SSQCGDGRIAVRQRRVTHLTCRFDFQCEKSLLCDANHRYGILYTGKSILKDGHALVEKILKFGDASCREHLGNLLCSIHSTALLIVAKGNVEGSFRFEAALQQVLQRFHYGHQGVLHIDATSPVDVAVLDDAAEWVHVPLVGLHWDD